MKLVGEKKSIDLTLLIVTFMLVCIGIMMVFSASYSYAMSNMGDGTYFLRRVIAAAAIGLFMMAVCSFINYRIWKKLALLMMVISFVLLVLVLTPLGTEINNARRWIHVAGLSITPAEIAKFSLIIYLAASLEKKKDQLLIFKKGILPYLLLAAAIFTLIYRQPDFSTSLVLVFITMLMIFVAGVRFSHFLLLALTGSAAITGFLGYILLAGQGYKTRRLTAFLDPWSDPSNTGLQAIQSLLAIGSGGFSGKGIGMSIQKHLHLPEPHNDFIFSIIAEEWGFLGSVFVLLLFAVFIWRCTVIAMNAPDQFGTLIATGLAGLVGIQAIINVGVATLMLPVTGIPLPFISFGGNSLVILLALTGVVLNISKKSISSGG